MNKGLRGFPSRDSLFSSGSGASGGEITGDQYSPADGVAYMTPSDDVVRGDLLGANPARNCFPLKPGSLPAGGTAGAAIEPAADVMAATNVLSLSGSGLTGGGVAVAYARSNITAETPATISATNRSIHDACLIASGDYVVGYGTAPTFQRFNPAGASQSSSDGSGAVGVADIAVCATSDGGFVGVWCSTSTPTIRFRRYNSAGVLQGTETVVEAITANRCSAAGLQSGGFVIAYVTSGALKFAIYDAGGTIVGTPASVASGISTAVQSSVSVASLSGGGFVIAYASTTSGGSFWFARYNSSGALQGSLTQIATATTVGMIDAASSNSGGFAVMYSATSSATSLAIFDSTGVQVGSTVQVAASSAPFGCLTNLPSGDFIAIVTALTFKKYSAGGDLVFSWSGLMDDSGPSPSESSIAPLLNEDFVHIYNTGSSLKQVKLLTTGSATLSRFDKSGVRVGLLVDLSAEPSRQVAVAGLDNGSIALAWTTKTGIPQVAVATRYGVVGAAAAAEAVYSRSVSIASLDGGGFVVAYEDYFGGRVRVRRYTSTGAAAADPVTVEATISPSVAVARLDTGGFAVAYLNASRHAKFATYTSSGSAALPVTVAYANPLLFVSVAGASAGRFGLLFGTSSTLFAALISASGAITLRNMGTAATSYLSGAIAPIPGDMYAVTYTEASGGNGVRTARLTADNELLMPAALVEGPSINAPVSAQAVTSGGDTWSIYVDGSNVTIGRYASSVVVVGVALASSSPGGFLPVRVSGSATLRLEWGSPQAFDHTDAMPTQGVAGTVVGRAAVLKGF